MMVAKSGRRGAGGANQVPLQPLLPLALPDEEVLLSEVSPVDHRTGQAIDRDERHYRARIMSESARGLIAVDRTYQEMQILIHQPLTVSEVGDFVEDTWHLQRANSTTLSVTPAQLSSRSSGEQVDAMQAFGIAVARKAVGDAAALLMRILYETANDPPYWRSRQITVRLTDLMDQMGYRKDANGYHRSANKRHLGQTLLALHYTTIGVQRSGKGGSSGALGPLLSALDYTTSEDTSNLTPMDVFRRGLPDVVTVTINERWYRMRDDAGRPSQDYLLIPRLQAREITPRATNARYTYITPVAALEAYFREVFQHEDTKSIVLTRAALRDVGGIRDTNTWRATKKITDALTTLRDTNVIGAYSPAVLPVELEALITIAAPRAEARPTAHAVARS